jgi:hypothetical protein
MTVQEPGGGRADEGEIHFPGGVLAFRFLVAVDAEGFSRCCAAEQAGIQADLDRALVIAAQAVGMDRGQWECQPRGDGELAELPLDTDGLSLVANFPRQLAVALSEINATRTAEPRLRLRIAIHHGAVSPGLFGPVGPAPILITRLLDANVLRRQLRSQPDRDLALIVSAAVYDEVVRTRFQGLRPEAFSRVVVQAKRVAYVGYLHQGDLAGTGHPLPATAAGA